MKYFNRSFAVLAIAVTIMSSCGDSGASLKDVQKDTSEKKFNPAGEQKQGDTYDPKVVATDTMYKNRDSVPKVKEK